MPDIPVIELVSPMPGFPALSRFALVQLDEDGTLCALRSLEEPDVRFLVLPPGPFFPGYEPVIDDATAETLQLAEPEDALLLVVVNAGASLADSTVNLMAPVLVNVNTRRAQQILLDDPQLPIAAPLLAA